MKAYTSFRGAYRASDRGNLPILRLLNGSSTEELFVVLDDHDTVISAINPKTACTDGRVVFRDLSAGHVGTREAF